MDKLVGVCCVCLVIELITCQVITHQITTIHISHLIWRTLLVFKAT
jgi:hypothetical protein